ncbi:MAG: hypothetical protein KC731_15960 [Myxococcales bacterium]|nr:hypothetical protein [Myxococcales bacterium]
MLLASRDQRDGTSGRHDPRGQRQLSRALRGGAPGWVRVLRRGWRHADRRRVDRLLWGALAGPGDVRTLEVWATLQTTGASAALMSFRNTEGGDPEYVVSTVSRTRFEHRRGDMSVVDETMAADIQLDGLHHLVVTVDAQTAEGQLYVDGRRLLSPPAILMARPHRGEHDLVLARTDTTITLHDYAVYDTILSEERIAEHCRCGFGPDASQGKCISPPTRAACISQCEALFDCAEPACEGYSLDPGLAGKDELMAWCLPECQAATTLSEAIDAMDCEGTMARVRSIYPTFASSCDQAP